jgi:hypothetical protein
VNGIDRYSNLTDDQLRLVYVVCETFERATRDEKPSIERQLEAAPSDLKDLLFCELLSIEVESRLDRKETLTIEDYETRFT